jgi:predicted transglutaminase-like cysteine proteinase
MEKVLTEILENTDKVSEILAENNISEISDFNKKVNAKVNAVSFKKI